MTGFFPRFFSKKESKPSADIQARIKKFTHELLPEGLAKYTHFLSSTCCVFQIPFPVGHTLEQDLTDLFSDSPDFQWSIEFVPDPSQKTYKQIQHILLVSSGKGGVGKSTTAVNLARALAEDGAKVGLLDADIYGPSIPLMMGVKDQKPVTEDQHQLKPILVDSIKLMSIGFLVPEEKATIWRGPMASKTLQQLLSETDWGTLDYLIVDMPPGTGDIQLTMSQQVPCSGAVIVTTPQDIALADARKGLTMFQEVNVPIIGLIENMSYYHCPSCGHEDMIFGQMGAQDLATRYQVEVLGQFPLQSSIREAADCGHALSHLDTQVAALYRQIGQKAASRLHYARQYAQAKQPEIIMTDD